MQDNLKVENDSLKEKVNVLEKQLCNFEDQAEKSLNETYRDEYQELQSQLNTYMLNNVSMVVNQVDLKFLLLSIDLTLLMFLYIHTVQSLPSSEPNLCDAIVFNLFDTNIIHVVLFLLIRF